MAYTVQLENNIIRVRVTGVFSPADLAAAGRDVAALEAQLPVTPPRVIDFTEADDFATSYEHIRKLAEVRRNATFANAFKSAVVVSQHSQYGYARMFQILNDHPQIRLAIFATLEAALAWIAEPGLELPQQQYSPPIGTGASGDPFGRAV